MGAYLHSRDKRRVINALFKYFKLIYTSTESEEEEKSEQ